MESGRLGSVGMREVTQVNGCYCVSAFPCRRMDASGCQYSEKAVLGFSIEETKCSATVLMAVVRIIPSLHSLWGAGEQQMMVL